jgi:hypothetical protein
VHVEPPPPKFTDEIDEMIYNFKLRKGTGLFIQKISAQNYMFGTKKIYAKVNNGILLIRVGGGFMDIEAFYK